MKSEKALVPILEGVVHAFGMHCAAALVELGEATTSIIAIANGALISRSVGDSALPFWHSPVTEEHSVTKTVTTKTGAKFRSTCMRLLLPGNHPTGLLIILDLTVPLIVRDYFQGFWPPSLPAPPPLSLDLSRALEVLLSEAVARVGKPVTLMGKDEKLTVIRYLDEHGAFLLRGSVEDVARELQISRFTVYNYLDEIRTRSDDE
ncbi:MAG: helix-turn-helix domain-containing protein [Chloroflexota bacterium]|nr:helix-turn-helix domain-containing protein [Chloroflexota bacterium]